jgi:hypothetical protein
MKPQAKSKNQAGHNKITLHKTLSSRCLTRNGSKMLAAHSGSTITVPPTEAAGMEVKATWLGFGERT